MVIGKQKRSKIGPCVRIFFKYGWWLGAALFNDTRKASHKAHCTGKDSSYTGCTYGTQNNNARSTCRQYCNEAVAGTFFEKL